MRKFKIKDKKRRKFWTMFNNLFNNFGLYSQKIWSKFILLSWFWLSVKKLDKSFGYIWGCSIRFNWVKLTYKTSGVWWLGVCEREGEYFDFLIGFPKAYWYFQVFYFFLSQFWLSCYLSKNVYILFVFSKLW